MLPRSSSLLLLVCLSVGALLMPACAIDGTEDDDFEEEPMVSSEEALSAGNVNCKTTRMTAYDKGKAYPIDVITIGSKRASKTTGHAFLKMQAAAKKAGVNLTLSSGFRTNDEQTYFYNCYKTKKCNNGNLAAKPGYSNHQNGRALDLSTSSWLAKNAGKYGFKRTVANEPWHYEYNGPDPGGPCSGGSPASTEPDEPEGADVDDDNNVVDPPTSTGKACASDGTCNPGNDGSGLVCVNKQCVDGCRTNAQCPGATTCKDIVSGIGKCR